MAHTITVIVGDRPEATSDVQRILDASGAELSWQTHHTEDGRPTDALLASARAARAVLMGHQTGNRDSGEPTPIVHLRRALGVFANVRPAHAMPGIATRFPNTDLVVVRETTEDIYAGLEHESIPQTYESLKVTTRAGCERIARYGLQWARDNGRKKLTVVHKANIMKQSDGMFLDVAKAVAQEFDDIVVDECIVDALCMKLVRWPDSFDVLLCGNLFGDIVADLAAGLVGGRANAPSMNVGEGGVALFTTGHGDGDGTVPPTSLAFAGVLLLRHLGEQAAADRVMQALSDVTVAGVTTGFASAVVERL